MPVELVHVARTIYSAGVASAIDSAGEIARAIDDAETLRHNKRVREG